MLAMKHVWGGPAFIVETLEVSGARMFALEPRLRRVVYVIVFEIIAIASSTLLLMFLSGGPAQDSLPIAIIVSAIAMMWNYAFNMMFEAWERWRKISERTLKVRILHTIGFELGLFVVIVPLYMLWYRVGFVDAFMMEAALLLFFLVYTFVFTFVFDTIFVLPQHFQDREKLDLKA
ncbi:PACE efflux transporter [Terrihabitans sp. B22-R8]|uniref:PACE efflux transporter n=1 Tax=Terrihabitans sp. B22-R8 TaxID=3425128 RepID=UPI00403D1103